MGMYLDFYGFREKPFNLTPDPRYLFLSKSHREAFAHLLYGVNSRAGFIALTGEVGSGKTTVLRGLLSQLDSDLYRTALIFNPCLSAPELLQSINRELGIPNGPSNSSSLLDGLNLFLLRQNADGRTVVLVIDEAQNLEAPVLEQMRLISNLETDKEKLIQIVLSGQPEFIQTLERKEMRQLSQRIVVRYQLQPMDFQDSVNYIGHRLLAAGAKSGDLFSRRALRRIYRYSRGLPRLINAACDRALLAGYTRDTAKISSRIAAVGIEEIKRETPSWFWKRRIVLVPALVVLVALLGAGLYLKRQGLLDRFAALELFEAKERRTQEGSAPGGERLSRSMASELGRVSESESARRAFRNLAGFWNVQPNPEGADLRRGMERAALDKGLRLHRFYGNLGALLRIDYPAALELSVPGVAGKRFISLMGIEKGKALVDPVIPGWSSLSLGEIEQHWSGHGFLLWKDSLNLAVNVSPGSKGSHIKGLQELLREAGVFRGPLTDIYDGETVLAVKEFQLSKGITQDGIVGDQTLMLLYRSVDRFKVPRLTGERK